MGLDVCLVKYEDERQLRLVENARSENDEYCSNVKQIGSRDKTPQDMRMTHLHAYNIFDIKVAGAVVRGVSMIYATTVGIEDATASVMIAPEADQVKISICPGVSKIT